MTIRLAVLAMIVTSTLALLAGGVFVLVNFQYVGVKLGLPDPAAKDIQQWTTDLFRFAFPLNDFDKLFGSLNVLFQGLNAIVTFFASKFLRRTLPSVAEANGQWHWVSVVRSIEGEKVRRVKRGVMNIAKIQNEGLYHQSPDRVITGRDLEMNGVALQLGPAFQATDIVVGTLGTERIIFNYKYNEPGNDIGISNLSLVRGVRSFKWYERPFRRTKNELIQMSDSFLVDGLVGKGEAQYFRNATDAVSLYNNFCAQLEEPAS